MQWRLVQFSGYTVINCMHKNASLELGCYPVSKHPDFVEPESTLPCIQQYTTAP
jgi:hypothetical protein